MEGGGHPAEALEAFQRSLGENDTMAYLAMMTPRLVELRRVLKVTGSIFLHCDPTASHYLKIIMDSVFGTKNFRNEIIWHYRRWSNVSSQYQKMHDVIFFYSKTDQCKFKVQYQPYAKEEYIEDTVRGVVEGKLVRLKDESGNYIKREKENVGVPMHDVWEDINFLGPTSGERLGYPTQKPLKLLERILLSSSDEGDMILDPFCGCGTAVHAAEKLNRKWCGIDITHLAIGLIEQRLFDAFEIRPPVIGAPEDLEGAQDLFNRSPFQFESWAVTRIDGLVQNEVQVGDGGVDGVGRFYLGRGERGIESYGKILASVKGGKNLGPAMIRDFRGAMEREGAQLGVFICLHKPTKGMIKDAASAGRYREIPGKDFQKIQIFTIKDYFAKRKPELPSTIKETRRRAAREGKEQHKLI